MHAVGCRPGTTGHHRATPPPSTVLRKNRTIAHSPRLPLQSPDAGALLLACMRVGFGVASAFIAMRVERTQRVPEAGAELLAVVQAAASSQVLIAAPAPALPGP